MAEGGRAVAYLPAFNISTLVRQLIPAIHPICVLEMLFGQLSHTKVLEPAPNHPVKKRIIGRELVGLPLVIAGFFRFA
jgi:hypothetical protein